MFIPVGVHYQQILQVNKDVNGNVTERELMGVRVSSVQSMDLVLSNPLITIL
jgi:hypothetical protein